MGLNQAVASGTNTPPVNLAAKVKQANAEHKLLLLEFGSSDSCPPCIELENKVFSQPEFLNYEKSNLVFVRLDFPLKSDLRPDTQATNVLLAKQFDAYVFPTFVALDKSGQEFWRMPGKNDPAPGIEIKLFEPTNFINLLQDVRKNEK